MEDLTKISARNPLKGTIVMASITNEAVDALKLAKGQPPSR